MKLNKHCLSILGRNGLGEEHAKVLTIVCMCEMMNGASKLDGSVLKFRYQVTKAKGPRFAVNKDVFEELALSSSDVVKDLEAKGFVKAHAVNAAGYSLVSPTMAGYDAV